MLVQEGILGLIIALYKTHMLGIHKHPYVYDLWR